MSQTLLSGFMPCARMRPALRSGLLFGLLPFAMCVATAASPPPWERQWLDEHLGKVVHNVEVAGVRGNFDEWAGYVDGKLVDVAAGYEYDRPSVGVLFVADDDSSRGTRYETPVQDGPVTIEGQHGGILTLATTPGRFEFESQNGNVSRVFTVQKSRSFFFDLRMRQFVTRSDAAPASGTQNEHVKH